MCTVIILSRRGTNRFRYNTLVVRGVAYDNLGFHDLAIKDLDEAIRLDATSAMAFYNRGIAHFGKANFDEAIASFDEAIRRDPDDPDAFRNRGMVYCTKVNVPCAIADFDEAIRLNPNDAVTLALRAAVYRTQGELDLALNDYNAAIRLDPNNAHVIGDRGVVYEIKGDSDRAMLDYNRAIGINPKDSITYYNRGRAYCAKGDFARAIQDFSEAIRINPYYPHPLIERGAVFASQSRFAAAIRDYDEALRVNPDWAVALYCRGVAKQKSGDESGGAKDLAAAAAIEPDIAGNVAKLGIIRCAPVITHPISTPDERESFADAASVAAPNRHIVFAAAGAAISVAAYWVFAIPGLAAMTCPGCFGFEPLNPAFYIERAATPGERALVAADAREATAQVSVVFGGMANDAAIFVCVTESCYRRVGGTRDTRGDFFSDGAVIISPRRMGSTILAHELTHVEFRHRLGSQMSEIPSWFDEGLAAYVSRDSRYLTLDQRANGCTDAGPLDSSVSAHIWGDAAEADEKIYAAAACRVSQWIAARGGPAAVIHLITQVKLQEAYTFAP